MQPAKSGDRVRISFRGMLTDGTVFDGREDNAPLELVLGKNQIFPVVEEAIIGMLPGETKTIEVQFEDAYGDYREELLTKIDRSRLPQGAVTDVGRMLQVQASDGVVRNVIVTEAGNSRITLDGNHPLAGKDLVYEINLREILES